MDNIALHYPALAALTLASPSASGQTFPNAKLRQKMLTEEQTFLADMKPGLQHTQMLAVHNAMNGDYAALNAIRKSRNQAPRVA